MRSKTLILGRPGAYSAKLAWKARLNAGALLGAAFVAVALVALAKLPVSVLMFAGIAVFAKPYQVKASKAAVGARSERRVARVLARSGYFAVVHGALLGVGGDADHVVLGKNVALVETKTGKGRVHVNGEGVRVGNRRIPGDPINQARRQAKAVTRHTGITCTPVLCIVDGFFKPFNYSGVTLTNLADLKAVLDTLPAVNLTRKRARQLGRHLHAR